MTVWTLLQERRWESFLSFNGDKKGLLKITLAIKQVVTVPGASYPEKISLIEIAGLSAEPCAGTHLTNTGEVGDQFMR